MMRVWCVVFTLIMLLGGAPPVSLAQVGSVAAGPPQAERPRVVWLGFVQEGNTRVGILGWEGLVYLVREGDTILGTYRVEQLGEDFAILRDGETEVRASYRPGSVQSAHSPAVPQGGVASPGLPSSPRLPKGLRASGARDAAEASTPGAPSGATVPPGSTVGAEGAGQSGPQGVGENPFAKSLQGSGQTPSSLASPQDNPFLRALGGRASTTATPQENQAQQGSPVSPADNPLLRALRERMLR